MSGYDAETLQMLSKVVTECERVRSFAGSQGLVLVGELLVQDKADRLIGVVNFLPGESPAAFNAAMTQVKRAT